MEGMTPEEESAWLIRMAVKNTIDFCMSQVAKIQSTPFLGPLYYAGFSAGVGAALAELRKLKDKAEK